VDLRGELAIEPDAVSFFGDREAFSAAIVRHGPDVRRLCAVITLDHELAREAEQNAWARAWQKRHVVRDPDRFGGWIARVAANEAKQLLRHRRRHRTVSLDASVDPAGSADDPGLHAGLRDALRRLEPVDRELLGLRYVLDLGSAEIGRHLGLSPEGVRSRLKRVRDRLRRELSTDA
jgi:RNA polymerase sigma-70 factor (ECF subfamily)